MSVERLKSILVKYSQKVYHKGWVANHDGNLSVRLEEDRWLITPTAMSKGEITQADLLIVDLDGRVLEGHHKPFSEFDLHRTAYGCRPEIQAVLHAHPPRATGFAVAGVALDPPFIAEAVVSLGDTIPTVSYALPGSDESTQGLRACLQGCDAVLLQNHGVLTVGDDIEQAFLRMELVEHLARIKLVAQLLGGACQIPSEDMDILLEKRRKAGLGPQARRQPETPETEATPQPQEVDAELVDIISQEVRQYLAERRRR